MASYTNGYTSTPIDTSSLNGDINTPIRRTLDDMYTLLLTSTLDRFKLRSLLHLKWKNVYTDSNPYPLMKVVRSPIVETLVDIIRFAFKQHSWQVQGAQQ